MKSLRILLGLFVLYSCSCSNDQDSYQSVDLSTASGLENIQVETIFSEPRLIRLETEDEYFLPSYFAYWIGGEHIIIFTHDQIIQYTAEGKFVRLLKERGMGPDEFSRIACYDVDEFGDILYYYDVGEPGKLALIDLVTGNQIEYITLPDNNELEESGLRVLKDGSLLCFNNLLEESKILYYYLNTGSEQWVIVNKPDWMLEHPLSAYWAMIYNTDDIISYMSGVADTLFRIKDDRFISDFIIELDNRYHPDDRPSGFFPVVIFDNTKYLLIKQNEVVSQYDEGLERISRRLLDTYDLFLYDKKVGSVTAVEDIYIKIFKVPVFSYIKFSGPYASVIVEANVIMSWKETLLSDEEAGKGLSGQLVDCIKGVDDNDNPYILAGGR